MLAKLLILVVALNSLASQALLKRAVTQFGAPGSLADLTPFFKAASLSPLVYASLLLQVLGYAAWMVVISKEKLGVAVAFLGSGFYIAIAVMGWLVFNEPLSHVQWAGILLITIGIGCMMV
jgi:drug/metabolite transporter (DMT)-like permease